MSTKTPLKIGIIENNLLIAESIIVTLQQMGYQTTPAASNYTDAIKMIETETPDLLLVDIMLDGEQDGIDLAATVNKDYGLPFIFLTGNSDNLTVNRAKEVKPSAYLVKPFNTGSLYTAIEIAFSNYNEAKANAELMDHVFLKEGGMFKKIAVNLILYVESDNVYLSLYTTSAKYVVRTQLDHFSEAYKKANLMRVHRSYAVNLSHVEKINNQTVMVGGKEIPLGKAYRQGLLNALNALR